MLDLDLVRVPIHKQKGEGREITAKQSHRVQISKAILHHFLSISLLQSGVAIRMMKYGDGDDRWIRDVTLIPPLAILGQPQFPAKYQSRSHQVQLRTKLVKGLNRLNRRVRRGQTH